MIMLEVIMENQLSLFQSCLAWNGNEIYYGLDYYQAVGQYAVEHFDYEEVPDDDGSEAPMIPLLNIVTQTHPELPEAA